MNNQSEINYKKKYKKYKEKYLSLKKSLHQPNNCVHNYYFIHTTNWNNLIHILKDGIIYPNKFIDEKFRLLSGHEQEHVFTNIYFDGVDIIKFLPSISIILHPKILYENGLIFNEGWVGGPYQNSLFINTTDSPREINSKLNQIRDFLINPISLPEIIRSSRNIITHEVLFDHPIHLDNHNLLAIVCYQCDIINLNKIKKIIKTKSFSKIKILTESNLFPTLDQLLIN